jgi:hypothetical protein
MPPATTSLKPIIRQKTSRYKANYGELRCQSGLASDTQLWRLTGVIVLVCLIRQAFSLVPTHLIEQLFTNLHAAIQKLQKQ